MKLNFWQWLAVVLLIIGLAWWIYDWKKPRGSTGSPAPSNPPATQPTTNP